MFDFINSIRARGDAKAAKIVSDADRYFALVRKGGTAGKLTPAETTELAELAERLEMPPEAVLADTKAVAGHAQQWEIARHRETHAGNHADAANAAETYRAQTTKLVAERDAEQNRLEDAARGYLDKVRAADKARTTAESIRRANHKLFGLPEPVAPHSAPSNVRRALFAGDARGSNYSRDSSMFWMGTMLSPSGPHDRLANFNGLRFIPVDGQSAEELAELITMLEQAAKHPNGHTVRFLLTLEQAIANPAARVDRNINELTIDPTSWRPATDPARYHFGRLPGQPQAQLDAHVKTITALHAVWKERTKPREGGLPMHGGLIAASAVI